MNLHETAMGQRFFNVQLPALINTLKDIAAALSRPAPSAISFPADPRFLTSLYYGEYEADVFKLDKRLTHGLAGHVKPHGHLFFRKRRSRWDQAMDNITSQNAIDLLVYGLGGIELRFSGHELSFLRELA